MTFHVLHVQVHKKISVFFVNQIPYIDTLYLKNALLIAEKTSFLTFPQVPAHHVTLHAKHALRNTITLVYLVKTIFF